MPDDLTPTGDSGAPAPSPAPAAAADPTAAPQVPSGQTAKPTGYTYPEDRSQWIPKHRFDQVNSQATRAAQLEQELAAERKRVQALAGVTPTDPDEANTERVRNAFFQMFPQFKHLASMSEEQIQQLVQAPQQFQKQNDAELKQWQRHGNQQVGLIAERVAAAMGADSLTPRQTEKLRTTFSAWIRAQASSELQATGGRESVTLQKYEDGDESVVDAFVKEYVEDFVAPARRQVAAQNINRTRPVPNSAGRTQVTQVKRPESFASLDDRLDYAAKLAKERGMSFGQ